MRNVQHVVFVGAAIAVCAAGSWLMWPFAASPPMQRDITARPTVAPGHPFPRLSALVTDDVTPADTGHRGGELAILLSQTNARLQD